MTSSRVNKTSEVKDIKRPLPTILKKDLVAETAQLAANEKFGSVKNDKKVNLSQKDINEVVDIFFMLLMSHVSDGNDVTIRGVGKFYTKESKSGYFQKSKKRKKKAETHTEVKFIPSRNFKKMLKNK